LLGDFVDTVTVRPGIPAPVLAGTAPAVNVGNRVSPAQAIEKHYPVYPDAAIQGMLESIVVLDFTIDAGGGVSNARVLKAHALLEDAAMQAIRQWRFRPAMVNARSHESHGTVTFIFKVK
jgi:protein TonB